MFKFLKRSRVSSLQNQYEKLMHEAYTLSKVDPETSFEKQKKALAIQREILSRS